MKIMKSFLAVIIFGATILAQGEPSTNSVSASGSTAASVETIVCVRHGEKPHGGLGQLTCRGLNRALALPKVLLAKYGQPQFIFAPNPMHKVDGNRYYYVRPLTTIEPTAIRCGLPVNTAYGYDEIDGLEAELAKPKYEKSIIFLAWEHGKLADFARQMVKHHGGDPKTVPAWPGSDYDTIYVFKITETDGHKSFNFSIDHEGLNGLSDECP
jgi:hypothetical protein